MWKVRDMKVEKKRRVRKNRQIECEKATRFPAQKGTFLFTKSVHEICKHALIALIAHCIVSKKANTYPTIL